MIVGMVNNNTNNVYSSKQKVAFQAKTYSSVEVIAGATRAYQGDRTSPIRLRYHLGELLKLLNKSGIYIDTAKIASFNLNFSKMQGPLTKKLKSPNINQQKEVIKKVFDLKSEIKTKNLCTNVVDDYLFKKVVPHIVKTKDSELARQVLEITDRGLDERTVNSIQERIKLIKELGTEANIAELSSYRGEQQYGVPNYQVEDLKVLSEISRQASEAIEKLKTNPNFEVKIVACVPD